MLDRDYLVLNELNQVVFVGSLEDCYIYIEESEPLTEFWRIEPNKQI